MENGEDVPAWLKNGDYEFEYNIIRSVVCLVFAKRGCHKLMIHSFLFVGMLLICCWKT
jgi:hypothetical protein